MGAGRPQPRPLTRVRPARQRDGGRVVSTVGSSAACWIARDRRVPALGRVPGLASHACDPGFLYAPSRGRPVPLGIHDSKEKPIDWSPARRLADDCFGFAPDRPGRSVRRLGQTRLSRALLCAVDLTPESTVGVGRPGPECPRPLHSCCRYRSNGSQVAIQVSKSSRAPCQPVDVVPQRSPDLVFVGPVVAESAVVSRCPRPSAEGCPHFVADRNRASDRSRILGFDDLLTDEAVGFAVQMPGGACPHADRHV